MFDVTPPIERITGTAGPLALPAGTRTFTWYSPTAPGARPEKKTLAGAPPIVTVGLVGVEERGLARAGEPLGG